MTILRGLGIVLVIAGLVLVCAPTLVVDLEPAPDTFEAVEQRVRFGIFICVGLLLAIRTRLRPWRETLAHVVLWLSGGYLIARVIGMAFEGLDSTKQWTFFVVEVVICLVAALYLRRRHKAQPSPG